MEAEQATRLAETVNKRGTMIIFPPKFRFAELWNRLRPVNITGA